MNDTKQKSVNPRDQKIAALVFGGVALLLAVVNIFGQINIEEKYLKAEGVVFEIVFKRRYGPGGWASYEPNVKYYTQDGQLKIGEPIIAIPDFMVLFRTLKVGDKVNLLYDPNGFEVVLNYFFARFWLTIVGLAIGLPFLVVGLKKQV